MQKDDKILITGGTGFIGKNLALKCSESSGRVVCLGLKEDEGLKLNSSIEFIYCDLLNKEGLKKALAGNKFNYVFNLGGYIDHTPYRNGGRKNIESHFTGLMNLLDVLDWGALKGFVQAGSSDEYGDAPSPQKEGIRETPIAPYSLAKTCSAQLIEMLSKYEGFPGTVVRFFLVYGPGQDQKRFMPQIIKACLKNEEFKTSEGNQLRDFCFIDDIVDGLIKAVCAKEAHGQIINLASGRAVKIRDVVQKIVDLANGGKPLWGAHPYRKGENMSLYADISKAKNILKWAPKVDLDEGLCKTIKYFNGGVK